MKLPLLLLALTCAALSAGCSGDDTLPAPKTLTADGTFTHDASGMKFPSSVGRFLRGEINQYDASGKDVSAGYNLLDRSCPTAATVYVSDGGRVVSFGSSDEVIDKTRELLFDNAFEGVKAAVVEANPGAELVSEGDVELGQAGRLYAGKKATFRYEREFAGERRQVQSDAFLFPYGQWHIKYRFTYPAEMNAGEEIGAFMRALRWTLED